jgi:glucose/arabinose dehydrogenase
MKSIFTLLAAVCLCIPSFSQLTVIDYQPVATGLNQPVDIVSPADGTGRIFVVQQPGIIRIWDGSAMRTDTFLNVIPKISAGGERGLLSMAFHPDYINNRYFFVYYTKTGNGSLTIERYRTLENNVNKADPASGVEILNILHPSNSNHNGGKLNFGNDGYLYLGTGDGGGSNDVPGNAQNGASLLGKMLRIDVNDFTDNTPPRYSIPPTNPYINTAGVSNEIVALGLRNPFRWNFDRLTGDMWIGDVGQNVREEINFRSAAAITTLTNYGWRCLEGSITNPNSTAACPAPANYVAPVFDYPHNSSGGQAVTGGIVYRGTEFPALVGTYICTDFYTGNIWLIKPNVSAGWTVTPQTTNRITNISAFGETEDGAVYAVKLGVNGAANTGILYKVIADGALPIRLLSFTGKSIGSFHELAWKITGATTGDTYTLERKTGAETNFTNMGSQQAAQNNIDYSTQIASISNDTYYRLKIESASGVVTFSPIIRLQKNDFSREIFTANISGGFISLQLLQPARSVQILNASGALLASKQLNGQSGLVQMPLANIPKSVIFVKVISNKGQQVKKLVW